MGLQITDLNYSLRRCPARCAAVLLRGRAASPACPPLLTANRLPRMRCKPRAPCERSSASWKASHPRKLPWKGRVRGRSLEADRSFSSTPGMTKRSRSGAAKTGPEIIRLAVMLYVSFPPSLCFAEDLLHARGTDINHKKS